MRYATVKQTSVERTRACHSSDDLQCIEGNPVVRQKLGNGRLMTGSELQLRVNHIAEH